MAKIRGACAGQRTVRHEPSVATRNSLPNSAPLPMTAGAPKIMIGKLPSLPFIQLRVPFIVFGAATAAGHISVAAQTPHRHNYPPQSSRDLRSFLEMKTQPGDQHCWPGQIRDKFFISLSGAASQVFSARCARLIFWGWVNSQSRMCLSLSAHARRVGWEPASTVQRAPAEEKQRRLAQWYPFLCWQPAQQTDRTIWALCARPAAPEAAQVMQYSRVRAPAQGPDMRRNLTQQFKTDILEMAALIGCGLSLWPASK